MTLSKNSIISAVAEEHGYPVKQTIQIVETLREIIKSKLSLGEDVMISRFGKFCVKNKRERRGRNPNTGEDIVLADWRVVIFHCSGKLWDKVNKSQ
jgi:integration host factor subunit alpha